jgi:hypothetical protein
MQQFKEKARSNKKAQQKLTKEKRDLASTHIGQLIYHGPL